MTNIKENLANGILFLVGYYSILVTPDMPEYSTLLKLSSKKFSIEEKQNILSHVVNEIERII